MHPIFMEDIGKIFAMLGIAFCAILFMPYIIAVCVVKLLIYTKPYLRLKKRQYTLKLAVTLYIIEAIYIRLYLW